MRLMGQVASISSYALQGRVLEKYAPKQDARSFFVRLDGVGSPVWFSVAHFSKFEPMDVIGVVSCREGSKGLWVNPRDMVVVIQVAVVPVREVTLELGYVSNPRHVFEGQYWYMFKLGQCWHRCYYDVAARYWLGDSSQDSLLAEDYYALLGIGKSALFQSVRSAWKRMITEHHPDRWVVTMHGQEVHDYHARLAARVNAARDCLTDVGERERYDQQLQLGYSGPQQEAIRAWPGRGFGMLRAKVEDRGSVVLVKEILSWEPQRHVFEGTVSLAEFRAWGDDVRLRIPILQGIMQVGYETLKVPKALLPAGLVRAIERREKGDVRYRFEGIRTGGYSMDKGVYTWIRVQTVEVTWTPA